MAHIVDALTLNLDANEVARQELDALIRDGVELRATEQVLTDWFYGRGYGVLRNRDLCFALHGDGRRLAGQDQWLTYHEMVADLLARIDAEGGAS